MKIRVGPECECTEWALSGMSGPWVGATEEALRAMRQHRETTSPHPQGWPSLAIRKLREVYPERHLFKPLP